VVFVPADAYIPSSDYTLFAQYVRQALAFAASHDAIGLLGVKPTYPATGYGYIEYDPLLMQQGLYKVARFHEKPSERLASNYVQMPHMLWNICMFVGKASVFIDECQRMMPELYDDVMAWQEGKKSYQDILNISIDYAVMERSNRVWVLPVDFSWCDVGNVEVFLTMKQKVQPSNELVVTIDAKNNLIDVPDKMVALVGVDDLCIIETADALLITKRSESEKVRAVVAQLKKENQNSYL
jgi:mannose-1-phosphate guanylyltransferase